MINRIERPVANDHPDGSFSVHLFLHRPKTQNSRIIGQYTHNLLGLITSSFSVLLFIHKNMDKRSPNWVRHAKCTWSSLPIVHGTIITAESTAFYEVIALVTNLLSCGRVHDSHIHKGKHLIPFILRRLLPSALKQYCAFLFQLL